ncbi:FecR family protein [Niastella populi]|uniref:FecR protein domain-containing protein n=1 Tax=Niastella populi TaxID=550983 RepID=A0A1V9GAJ0_9BACT|nr:FecR family protein [Niastella populi]OQP67681.1 hypothetical protein A4R26_11500 [Niastella populi]
MEANKIALLIFRYQKNNLQDHEQEELQEWLEQSQENRDFFNRVTANGYQETIAKIDKAAVWQKIVAPSREKQSRKIKFTYQEVIAAAIILLLLSVALYAYIIKNSFDHKYTLKTKDSQDRPKEAGKQISVSSNLLAIPFVRLWNGAIIDLNTLSSIQPLRIGHLQITYANRHIKFDTIPGFGKFDAFTFPFFFFMENSITSPPNYKIHVTLPDGTEITLNEKSTLQFSSPYVTNARRVELSGEAYFKVKPQYLIDVSKVPFFVKANSMEIKVTGTEFNVTADKNNGTVRTTLIEGQIEAIKDTVVRKLVPGQEITLNDRGELTSPKQINVKKAVAWKMSIKYKNASVQEVLKEIERLYGVTIICNETFDNELTITIPPQKTAREALEFIRKLKVANYTIDGKIAIVKKYSPLP